MNSKKNIVFSSLLGIVMCLCLIVGGTFAMFTSNAQVNIAVTSGKVDVKAVVSDLQLYSPASLATDGTVVNADNAATATNFVNGGTATLNGNTLTLNGLSAGDKVKFKITLTSESNIKTLYRYGYEVNAAEGKNFAEAKKIYSSLVFGLDEIETSKYVSYKTGWTEFTSAKELNVSVELPATAGNEAQGLSGEIVFTVEVVQGNAQVGAGEEYEYKLADAEGLQNALKDINQSEELDSATLKLADDLSFADDVESLVIASGKDVTIDLAGNDLTVTSNNSDGITVSTGSTLTLGNSAETGKYNFNSIANSADCIFVSNDEDGKGATLNISGDVEINVGANANSAIHAYATKGSAVVNMDGATVNIKGNSKISALVADQNSVINMENCVFNLSADFDSYNDSNDVVGIILWGQNGKQDNISVNIGEGTVINVGGKNAFAQGLQISLKNGYSNNVNVIMNGGKINLNPTEKGEGYAFTTYKDVYGTFVVNGGEVTGNVTAIGNAYIGTIQLTIKGGTYAADPTAHVDTTAYNVTKNGSVWTVTAK